MNQLCFWEWNGFPASSSNSEYFLSRLKPLLGFIRFPPTHTFSSFSPIRIVKKKITDARINALGRGNRIRWSCGDSGAEPWPILGISPWYMALLSPQLTLNGHWATTRCTRKRPLPHVSSTIMILNYPAQQRIPKQHISTSLSCSGSGCTNPKSNLKVSFKLG